MASYRTSRVFPVVIIIIVIAIAIAALVSVARVMFPAGESTDQSAQVDTDKANLLNSSIGHAVSMSVRGPVVADEDFRSYKIVISPSSRTITTYQGYVENRIDGKTLGNSVTAYEQFIYSLDKVGLLKGKSLSGDSNDTRGVCASGEVYTFDVLFEDKSVKNLWASSCNGSKGSLDANVSRISELFIDQIPGSTELIRAIDL